jgi:hypothetical protein
MLESVLNGILYEKNVGRVCECDFSKSPIALLLSRRQDWHHKHWQFAAVTLRAEDSHFL